MAEINLHKIEILKIDDVRPNDYNPNRLPPEMFAKLKAEIQRVGFLQPILIDKNGIIIDGEHRWKALKELGAPKIPVIRLEIDAVEAKIQTLNMNLIKGVLDGVDLSKMLADMAKDDDIKKWRELVAIKPDEVDYYLKIAQKDPLTLAESLYNLKGTQYEGKTPEGLQHYTPTSPIQGATKINEKYELTFVFDAFQEMQEVQTFFTTDKGSKVPDGHRLFGLLGNLKKIGG